MVIRSEKSKKSSIPTVTVTSKGRITIPKSIREAFDIKPGDRVEFFIDDEGKLVLWPITQDITSIKGIVNYSGPAVSIDDMNETVRKRGGKI